MKFGDEIAEKGGLETIHGDIVTPESLNRDGYDYFELILTNANGKTNSCTVKMRLG